LGGGWGSRIFEGWKVAEGGLGLEEITVNMETMDLAREQNGIIYSETIETTAYSGALS